MVNSRLCLRSAIGLLFWALASYSSLATTCPIPLEKGTEWIYEGKVEWTVVNSAVVLSTNVHWVMEVVDVVERGPVRASVIRGLPDELAWYEPSHAPRFCVLIQVTNRVYRIPAKSKSDGETLARKLTREPLNLSSSAEKWLVLPLATGKRWGGDDEGENDREDHYYCWYVEQRKPQKLKVQGYDVKHLSNIWTLTYRTIPDHQSVDIVEGLGITRYVYVHHGTVASADVRLVSFRNPAKRNGK